MENICMLYVGHADMMITHFIYYQLIKQNDESLVGVDDEY